MAGKNLDVGSRAQPGPFHYGYLGLWFAATKDLMLGREQEILRSKMPVGASFRPEAQVKLLPHSAY